MKNIFDFINHIDNSLSEERLSEIKALYKYQAVLVSQKDV